MVDDDDDLVGSMDVKVEAAGVEMYVEDVVISAVCLLLVVEGYILLDNISLYFFILASMLDLIVSKEDCIEVSNNSSELLHV